MVDVEDRVSGAANGPAVPSIRPILITYAPPAGSSAQVVGTVDPELRADHRVLVYINVRGRWWGPKPGGEEPFTQIEPDGTWRCTIFTGGEDHLASEVAAYLVPSTLTTAPPAQGSEYLPIELSPFPFVTAIGVGRTVMQPASGADLAGGSATGPDDSSTLPIRITFTPQMGSNAQVVGTVDPGLHADHRVLVYINVRGRWWGPKPGGEEPFTRIEPDGTWRCTIFTGGEDHRASEIAAYLVPSTLTAAPPAQGSEDLPIELRVYPFVNADR